MRCAMPQAAIPGFRWALLGRHTMSEQSAFGPHEPDRDVRSKGGWFRLVILVPLARLRFIAILAVLGVLIVKWDTLAAYYEKWTRPLRGEEHAASSEYEYYCSMHPNFVTDNPK